MNSFERIYCRIVASGAIGILITLMVLATTKEWIWGALAYCFAFLHLVLFPIGVIREAAYRRLQVPRLVVLNILLSGIIGCLIALPILLRQLW